MFHVNELASWRTALLQQDLLMQLFWRKWTKTEGFQEDCLGEQLSVALGFKDSWRTLASEDVKPLQKSRNTQIKEGKNTIDQFC